MSPMRTSLTTVVLALSLAAPVAAQVQARQGSARQDASGRPVVTIDMDEDVIEGSLHTPDVVLTPQGPRPTHRNLIRIRQSFSRELLASASKI